MSTSTLTVKGQITIPIELRQLLGLHAGDTLSFQAVGDKIILFKPKDDITEAFGMFRVKKKISLSAIQKAIEKGAG